MGWSENQKAAEYQARWLFSFCPETLKPTIHTIAKVCIAPMSLCDSNSRTPKRNYRNIIRSTSSSVTSSVVRSYNFVVRGLSCAAISCAFSNVPLFRRYWGFLPNPPKRYISGTTRSVLTGPNWFHRGNDTHLPLRGCSLSSVF